VKCPLCDTTLPDGAVECTYCDWVRKEERHENVRDLMAFWLSIVPGLGHLYKGHVWLGGVIFFIVGPVVLLMSLVVLPATLGVSLVIPALFMASGMIHAYRIRDLRSEVVASARAYDHRPSEAH
jgi:hypothetical protein